MVQMNQYIADSWCDHSWEKTTLFCWGLWSQRTA